MAKGEANTILPPATPQFGAGVLRAQIFGNGVTDKCERRHAQGRALRLAQPAPAHWPQHSPPPTLQELSICAETEADADAEILDKKNPPTEGGLNPILLRELEETSEVCCTAPYLANHHLQCDVSPLRITNGAGIGWLKVAHILGEQVC